jgi:hypothetical protein
VGLGNKEVAWWLVSTSLDSSWGFLSDCGYGLASGWILRGLVELLL